MTKLIYKSKKGILIGLAVFLGLLLIPYSENFRHVFLFYIFFSILWIAFTFLIWSGFRFIKYLLVAAITIPAVVALIAYSGGYDKVASVSGTVSLGVFLSAIIIFFVGLALFLGPGVLAGLWIYNSLGSTIWSGLLGAMVGLGILVLTNHLLRRVIIPYSYGFGIAMLGGIVAHDLSNVIFQIHPSYLFNGSIDSFFDEIGRLNFQTLRNGIISIYLFLSWLLGGFGIKNRIIIAAAFGTGIFFVMRKLKFSSLLTRITRSQRG